MWNFKKNAVVDDLNTVPEQYRGLYVPGTGENVNKFVLNPVAVQIANDYDGVNTALADERGKTKNLNNENAQRRQAVAKFAEIAQGMGITVEEGADLAELLKGHIDGLNDQVKGGKEAKINLDKVNGDWTKKLNTAVEQEQGKTKKMQTALERYLVGQAAVAALAAAGGATDLLLPHVRSRVRVVQDGDDFVAKVVDDAGDIRTNGAGQQMSVNDLVAEMKTLPAFAPAFKSETKVGTGKQPAEKTAPRRVEGVEKTAAQKIEDGLAKRKAG